MPKKKCRCFLLHPSTKKERRRVVESVDYARKVGDTWAMAMAISQLTAYCPARDGRKKAS